MKGGAVIFRHENNQKYTVKGVSTTIKESIIDGDLGMSFKYLKKVGDDFYRIQAKFENGKYHGKGSEYDSYSHNIIYEGYFKNDRK